MVLNYLLHQGYVITLLLHVLDVKMQGKSNQKTLYFAKIVKNSKHGKKTNAPQRSRALFRQPYFRMSGLS